MVIFLMVLMLTCFSFISVMLVYVNRKKHDGHVTIRERYVPHILLMIVLLLFANVMAGSFIASRTPFCLMLGLLSFHSIGRKEMILVVAFEILLALYFLICSFSAGFMLRPLCFVIGFLLLLVTCSLLYVRDVCLRLRELRNVMRMGSVWESLVISVDAVYMVILLTMSFPFCALCLLSGYAVEMTSVIFSILLFLYQIALVVRISRSSVFVLWVDHERKIVESMRLTQLEISGDTPGSDRLYEAIYERILKCFEDDKPYLNPELSINDIVEKVYTNKLYISRSISQHTGRNFCQFVNYYRILHAVEIFRKNPKLRIVEMASRSGFNSSVSFTAAFRLYMGEKPGDWCRRERSLILKQKDFVAQ